MAPTSSSVASELLMPWPSAAASGVVGWRTTATASQRYHRPMSDTPFAEPYPEQRPPWGVPPPGWDGSSRPAPSTTPRSPGRWSLVAALALAVVSLGVGIVGWFHRQPHDKPSPAPSAPTFTSQQISDAKENVCAAHRIVRQAAVLNTNQANSVPGDPTGDLAVAANARLALYSGGDYLLRRLTAEPATPAELRDAVRSLANALQELAVNYLAGAPDSVVTPLRLALERDTRAVDPLCV
ncbi:hypothetical protein [Mycobacterium tuberculosis]|uniref:hypothetical protein n=1 Tax=Mycobacterium tuberculosis TaxID=1773 RepID=UPI0032B3A823